MGRGAPTNRQDPARCGSERGVPPMTKLSASRLACGILAAAFSAWGCSGGGDGSVDSAQQPSTGTPNPGKAKAGTPTFHGAKANYCPATGCACSNGIDDDGDGLADADDPECVGPNDNDEATFATGMPGDNKDPKWQDCFFD